jgi:hypothetical protein
MKKLLTFFALSIFAFVGCDDDEDQPEPQSKTNYGNLYLVMDAPATAVVYDEITGDTIDFRFMRRNHQRRLKKTSGDSLHYRVEADTSFTFILEFNTFVWESRYVNDTTYTYKNELKVSNPPQY